MRELPHGTVTFLFTDIEGSTRLLHDLGDDYAEALATHRRALREAFAARGGVEVDTQGDAFFYAFADAADAVAAAAAGRDALEGGPVLVRMGLHTGSPQVTEEGYVGLDVHLGARVAASGHGGQVLLTTATRELAEVEVLELGDHRLKDFADPVAIAQLGSRPFPPLKTISNTNLPRPASVFVGRERELAEVASLVRSARLVTLTGAGGSGKTRLALEAAAELVPEHRNGVFWVGLATLRDPALVPEAIAQSLGAKEELARYIGERELLLLLDNLEQVVNAAPELARLVELCPNLRLLVTSRELLRVRGEIEYSVPPLGEPDAVELFCRRSGVAAGADVEELCRRLDNLPLAIELAAARASVLSPRQLVERLGERLDLLRGGRDADRRQQTLRSTIAWSYDLLDDDEQRVFARLAVFVGGCTLTAAEAVCNTGLDTLQSLVDKSLVRWSDERFWMLETIREFAAERLRARAEFDVLVQRHAAWYAELVADLELRARHGDPEATHLLTDEIDNLRAGLEASAGRGDIGDAFWMLDGLWYFWIAKGHAAEGLRWARWAVGEAPNAHPRSETWGCSTRVSCSGSSGIRLKACASSASCYPGSAKSARPDTFRRRSQISPTCLRRSASSTRHGSLQRRPLQYGVSSEPAPASITPWWDSRWSSFARVSSARRGSSARKRSPWSRTRQCRRTREIRPCLPASPPGGAAIARRPVDYSSKRSGYRRSWDTARPSLSYCRRSPRRARLVRTLYGYSARRRACCEKWGCRDGIRTITNARSRSSERRSVTPCSRKRGTTGPHCPRRKSCRLPLDA